MSLAPGVDARRSSAAGSGSRRDGEGGTATLPSPPGPTPGRKLLTVDEVADLLRINKSTVYRMAKQGRLPATRVGRQWRFRRSVLESLLDS